MADKPAEDTAPESPDTPDATTTEQPTPAETPDGDALLDKMLADNEAAEQKAEAARDARGRFVKKPDDAVEKAETEPEPETDDEPAQQSKYSDDEQRRAIKALQRDDAPKHILDAATKGDAEAIAYALKRAKVQADGDEFTAKYKQVQQELEQLKSSQPAANSTAADVTTSGNSIPLAEYLATELGDEAAEKVRTSFADVEKRHTSEMKKRDQQVSALQKQIEDMAIDHARDALVSEYPQLKDRETWEKVRAEMDSLPESESRPNTLTRLDHAARIVLAPEIAKQSRIERTKRNQAKDAGSPSGNARAEALSAKSKAELGDLLLDAQMAGDTKRVEEIKAEIQTYRN